MCYESDAFARAGKGMGPQQVFDVRVRRFNQRLGGRANETGNAGGMMTSGMEAMHG
jgi:hypothetical protein